MVRRLLATRNQPAILIGLMVLDLLVNAAATKQQLSDHFDRMGIGPNVRRAILPVKVLGTVGLVVGRRSRPVAVLTAACFVVYFTLAIGYHRRVNDGPILTAPAVLYGGVAARVLIADVRR